MIKKIIASISLFVFIGLMAPMAFAQTGTTTPAKVTCADVQSAQSSGIYVILEEPLGGPDAVYCFRVCKILDPKDKNTTNLCKIQEKCEGGGNLGTNVSCQRIQILQADSGSNLIFKYVRMIYLWAAGTIGIISVFTLVYSGIGISAAGGDSAKIDEFKNRIMQSLLGLIVLFLSGLILYTINPTFFV
ncbi:hypothetical protein C0416_00265 [bacterium]|nr:hypothetical protein [bacterium]